MKLTLAKSYPKVTTVLDANGLPVIENGRPKTILKKKFLYAITNYTPEELAAYKRSKQTDGVDYFREGPGGQPLYHSNTFMGNICQLDMYTKADGTVGFGVDDTAADALMAMGEQFPALASQLQAQVVAMRLTGNRISLDPVAETAEITAPAGNTASEPVVAGGEADKLEEEEDLN